MVAAPLAMDSHSFPLDIARRRFSISHWRLAASRCRSAGSHCCFSLGHCRLATSPRRFSTCRRCLAASPRCFSLGRRRLATTWRRPAAGRFRVETNGNQANPTGGGLALRPVGLALPFINPDITRRRLFPNQPTAFFPKQTAPPAAVTFWHGRGTPLRRRCCMVSSNCET